MHLGLPLQEQFACVVIPSVYSLVKTSHPELFTCFGNGSFMIIACIFYNAFSARNEISVEEHNLVVEYFPMET